jgi:hypothetical protein
MNPPKIRSALPRVSAKEGSMVVSTVKETAETPLCG